MPCKIFLRHDQSTAQIKSAQKNGVTVYAPSWVQEGLNVLAEKLKNVEFRVHGKPSLKRGRNSNAPAKPEVLESFKISENFDNGNLVMLQKIARNEPRNTNGVVDTSLYLPEIKDAKLIYSIKDLARQSIVVGKDFTTHCGGYKSVRVDQKEEPVYICDLAALQFQKAYNSGRLVLVQETEPYKGPLDDLIFERVVGEKKKNYGEVEKLLKQGPNDKRYVKHDGFGKSGCFLDTVAYKKFVELDVLISGLALADNASKNGDKLNFKFLKYGTGYFAGKFRDQLDSLILSGVLDGLEKLFGRKEQGVLDVIRAIEFPFYNANDQQNLKRLGRLKEEYNIEFRFSRDDALKQTMKGKGVVTATTNCADTNVACGNAMGFKSTDGAISENLVSKGNIFCPNLNKLVDYKYIEI